MQVFQLKQFPSKLVDMERCGVIERVCVADGVRYRDSVRISP